MTGRILKVLIFSIAVCCTGTVAAQKSSVPQPAPPVSIDAIVRAQLDAFRRDDKDAAFSFASKDIQQQFGSADTFMKMVKLSYPIVYKHRRALFLDIVNIQGLTVQRVVFEDENGRTLMAHYPMVKNDAGEWRINGCYLLPAGQAT